MSPTKAQTWKTYMHSHVRLRISELSLRVNLHLDPLKGFRSGLPKSREQGHLHVHLLTHFFNTVNSWWTSKIKYTIIPLYYHNSCTPWLEHRSLCRHPTNLEFGPLNQPHRRSIALEFQSRPKIFCHPISGYLTANIYIYMNERAYLQEANTLPVIPFLDCRPNINSCNTLFWIADQTSIAVIFISRHSFRHSFGYTLHNSLVFGFCPSVVIPVQQFIHQSVG